MSNNPPIIAGTRIGHVHLKVADLDRALGFYCGVLGFEVTQRLSSGAAFISAGGYHHHIGLNTWESLGGTPPPRGTGPRITNGSPTSGSRSQAAWTCRSSKPSATAARRNSMIRRGR